MLRRSDDLAERNGTGGTTVDRVITRYGASRPQSFPRTRTDWSPRGPLHMLTPSFPRTRAD